MVTAVVGANWGDEGKGKITDMLGEESDIIVRFQGGSNAGHTIVNDYGKFALHILPSGVFYNHTTSVIGNGVALNIPDLVKEINGIVEKGVPKPKILVSDRAQIVMPYHILLDGYEEDKDLFVLAERLKTNHPRTHFYTSHCTGNHALMVMQDVMKEQLQPFSCGFRKKESITSL